MIYLDNASTTPTTAECANIALKFMTEKFFNPSAPYHPSVDAANELRKCRESILKTLRGDGKIIFTSGGTESDNLALFGCKKQNGSRIIVSASEHPAVMRSAEELKQRGYDVIYCPVDGSARVIVSEFEKLVNKQTSLISIMHVNNETGAVNDIKKLCTIAKKINPEVLFHSDGVQAVGKIRVNLNELGVDFYSVSGHKLGAPKGIGALYMKKGTNLRPILYGGGQEFGLRSSTENLAGAAAFAHAIKHSIENLEQNYNKISALNDYLRKELIFSQYKILSEGECSPYILCLSMEFIRGEVMLHSLEKYEIYIGTGSACSSKKSEKRLPSLLNLPKEYEKGIIRISLSENTTKNEIEYFIKTLYLEYSHLIKYMRG